MFVGGVAARRFCCIPPCPEVGWQSGAVDARGELHVVLQPARRRLPRLQHPPNPPPPHVLCHPHGNRTHLPHRHSSLAHPRPACLDRRLILHWSTNLPTATLSPRLGTSRLASLVSPLAAPPASAANGTDSALYSPSTASPTAGGKGLFEQKADVGKTGRGHPSRYTMWRYGSRGSQAWCPLHLGHLPSRRWC